MDLRIDQQMAVLAPRGTGLVNTGCGTAPCGSEIGPFAAVMCAAGAALEAGPQGASLDLPAGTGTEVSETVELNVGQLVSKLAVTSLENCSVADAGTTGESPVAADPAGTAGEGNTGTGELARSEAPDVDAGAEQQSALDAVVTIVAVPLVEPIIDPALDAPGETVTLDDATSSVELAGAATETSGTAVPLMSASSAPLASSEPVQAAVPAPDPHPSTRQPVPEATVRFPQSTSDTTVAESGEPGPAAEAGSPQQEIADQQNAEAVFGPGPVIQRLPARSTTQGDRSSDAIPSKRSVTTGPAAGPSLDRVEGLNPVLAAVCEQPGASAVRSPAIEPTPEATQRSESTGDDDGAVKAFQAAESAHSSAGESRPPAAANLPHVPAVSGTAIPHDTSVAQREPAAMPPVRKGISVQEASPMSPGHAAVVFNRTQSPVRSDPSPAQSHLDFLSQVAERISVQVQQGGTGIRIQLKPANLGHLDISASTGIDGVVARIVTESAAVRQYLESNIHVLEQALAEQGLRMERIDLVTQNAFDMRHSNTQQGNHQPEPRNQPQSAERAPAGRELPVDQAVYAFISPNSTFHTVA